MDCRVLVEAAVPIYDVESADEAVRIAISKTGEMLNPDLNYVEIEMADRTAPNGSEALPAFVAADEALVALELEMTVFNVEREEHAARIARKEIGDRLENIPLKVVEVEEIEEESEASAESQSEQDEDAEPASGRDGDHSAAGSADDDADDEVLPEFDELLEDEE